MKMKTLLSLISLFALLFAAMACSGARGVPPDARITVVSLQRIDCADCGERIVADLRARPGVYAAKFDRRRAQIEVLASPSFDVLTTAKSLAAVEGYVAMLGEGQGQYLEGPVFPAGADVRTVAQDGADVVDLASLVVPDKVTVIGFSALWCQPCRAVEEHIATLFASRSDVAYRRLLIGDWDTPLAQHYLRDVSQLPYVIVYDRGGQRVAAVVGKDIPALDAAIARAAAP